MPRFYIQLDLKASAYVVADTRAEAEAELLSLSTSDFQREGEVYECKIEARELTGS